MNEPTSNNGAFIAKLGAWLQVALALGLISAMLAIAEASKVLNTSGAGDPARFSAAIGDILTCIEIAVVLSLI
jgi:hypothetical protein